MCRQPEKTLLLLFNLALTSHIVLSKMVNSDIAEILHRPIRSLSFPENSNMGIFVAIAVPLEDPLNSISLSYFFEANYVLPPNITYFEPWTEVKRRKRNIERTTIYRVLESKFERQVRKQITARYDAGYFGRKCLLRAICETSEFPLQHNGLIGDIMHVIFTCLSYAQQTVDVPLDKNLTCEIHVSTLYARKMSKNYVTVLAFSMWYFMKSTHVSGVRNITDGVSRRIRSIGFPEGSNTGIFFAVGIPVNIPDKSIAVSFYFEANYGLPSEWNSSYLYEGSYYAKRSLSRKLVYNVLTSKIDSLGYPGLDCLLRTICEAEKFSFNENGVLGDILRIIFTPSTSMSEDLPAEIMEAESEQHCDQRYKKCPVNILDLASHYVDTN